MKNENNSEMVDPKKLIVSQSNDLVASAYKMTLQEKRLILLVISLIRKEDDCFKRYFLPIQQIQQYLEISSKDFYKRIRNIIENLMTRVIVFEDPRKGTIPIEEEQWRMFQWVSECRFIPAGRAPYGGAGISIKLNEELKGWLLHLKKNFASVPFKKIARMPSYNSIRIFEILYHESLSLKRAKFVLDLEGFKRRIGIEGKYPNYRDFRVMVLEKAQRDCEEKSPLGFSYEPIKRFGKKVAALRFTVWANQKITEEDMKLPEIMQIPINLEPTTPEDKLEHEMNLAGFTGDVWRFIQEDGIELTRASFEIAQQEIELAQQMGKEIKNPGGLILRKLQSRAGKARFLQEQKKLEEEKQRKERLEQERIEKEREQKHQEEQEKLLQQYLLQCKKNEETWSQLIQEFEEKRVKSLPPKMQLQYKESGIDDPVIRMFFEGFVWENVMNTPADSSLD